MNRAESKQMLELRADYEGREREEAQSLSLGMPNKGQAGAKMPSRTAPKTAHDWIFPHETPNREYFWGGWISLVIEGDKWEFDQPPQSAEPRPGVAPKGPKASQKSGAKS
jgi:hypothetical protein